ncbi:ATP-binding protein [Sessilibacter sp. MAH2]
MQIPKFNLALKLWLVLFFSSTTLVTGLLFWVQYSLDHGFKHYVARVSEAQIQLIKPKLEKMYKYDDSWQTLIENPRRWWNLQRITWFQASGLASEDELEELEERHLPRSHKDHDQRKKPPLPLGNLVLADKHHNILVGKIRGDSDDKDNITWQNLSIDGKTIGFVGFEIPKRLKSQSELHFLRNQTNNFVVIGLLALIASAAFAFPLAAILVKPVQKLQRATARLIDGKYDARVEIRGQDEIATLGKYFNELAQTLEANREQRKRWVADISHELRTPVTFLKGQIEAFIDGIRKPNKDNLEALNTHINQLTQLINDLYQLSVSELGALNYQKHETDLKALVDQVRTTVEPAFIEKGLNLRFSSNVDCVSMLIDRQRFEQLLLNLLNNSLNYTDAPGQVELLLERNGRKLMLVIQDSAPSVDAIHLGKLFDPLYRAENSRNRNSGGAGIGLAIVKNIVIAHDGTIKAEVSPLGGLKIIIELPSTPGQ